jgi:hypothetical protein
VKRLFLLSEGHPEEFRLVAHTRSQTYESLSWAEYDDIRKKLNVDRQGRLYQELNQKVSYLANRENLIDEAKRASESAKTGTTKVDRIRNIRANRRKAHHADQREQASVRDIPDVVVNMTDETASQNGDDVSYIPPADNLGLLRRLRTERRHDHD